MPASCIFAIRTRLHFQRKRILLDQRRHLIVGQRQSQHHAISGGILTNWRFWSLSQRYEFIEFCGANTTYGAGIVTDTLFDDRSIPPPRGDSLSR